MCWNSTRSKDQKGSYKIQNNREIEDEEPAANLQALARVFCVCSFNCQMLGRMMPILDQGHLDIIDSESQSSESLYLG